MSLRFLQCFFFETISGFSFNGDFLFKTTFWKLFCSRHSVGNEPNFNQLFLFVFWIAFSLKCLLQINAFPSTHFFPKFLSDGSWNRNKTWKKYWLHFFVSAPHRCRFLPFGIKNKEVSKVVVVVWSGIHSRSDTNRTGAEGLSFYYPRLLHCLDQTLAVMSLSQHRVSSSKTVRPRAPCGARCIGHTVRTWSAVCSEAPHSQFGEGARPHLCMDEWNRPTPVRRRLCLTQAARGKPIPTGLEPVRAQKHRAWKHLHSTPRSI